MNFDIDIQVYLKYPLNNGFEISEYKNYGMSEYCKLEYQILSLEIWRDRIDYYSSIIFNNNNYNTIHLANFLNDKISKYEFIDFSFETINVDSERFLTLLNQIIESEFDNILNFLFNITDEKYNDFIEYCEKSSM